ncbi:MAG: AMP-binding protein, partial [Rhodothermales bacterium]|nr:AMP-binding protein [Rhodothermales bacterium]
MDTIATRFESIARNSPDSIAVQDHQRSISYRELLRRAHALSARLTQGERRGSEPVLICLPHSVEMIVAVVAVLLSNKFFIGADPNTPPKRLEALCRISGTSLIVVNTSSAGTIHCFGGTASIVNMETAISNAAQPIHCLDELAPASLQFTSGTTGEPKAVARRHRDFLRRVDFETDSENLSSTDSFCLMYRVGFSAASNDVFLALLNGATLQIYDFELYGVAGISSWILDRQITRLHLPVEVYRQWLDSLSEGDFFPCIKQIIPSGKQMVRDYQNAWRYLSADCTFVSRYASTETGMVSRHVISRQNQPSEDPVPVGYPLEESNIRVLDENLCPLKDGDIGEIMISGHNFTGRYWDTATFSSALDRRDYDNPAPASHMTGDFGYFNDQG